MTKIIKDLSFDYKNEEVPNRLWHKIQGTIQNQENTVSFFSFQKINLSIKNKYPINWSIRIYMMNLLRWIFQMTFLLKNLIGMSMIF